MISWLITKLVGQAVAVFYDIERIGPGLTSGPVLVTANHPNALVDPLVIFHTGGRKARPLAKAPLFGHSVVGPALRALGGLPVYRKEDSPAQMHMNERTFDAVIDALTSGEAVQIYPEGKSHSEPSMAPLRTGAARIALLAEHRSGWSLGLKVQPVGLTYERKPFFRSRAVATYGEPISVAEYRDQYEDDSRKAVRTLTEDIREGLLQVTLQFETTEDRDLVSLAERIWAREKGAVRPRERQSLSQRLPRMRTFVHSYARLRSEDPVRADRLRSVVRRYQRMVTALGVREGDVPPRYRPSRVATYALGQFAMLLFVLPAALVGMAFWAAPYEITRRVTMRIEPKHNEIATYKLTLGLLTFPLWLGLATVLTSFGMGVEVGFLVLRAAPIVGLAAIVWRAREGELREDVRLFLRARRRRHTLDRLQIQRTELVREFEDVVEGWSNLEST